MARVMRSIASSCPKMRSRSLPGRSRNAWRPRPETAATGRPVMPATTAAISLLLITWRRAAPGRAPAAAGAASASAPVVVAAGPPVAAAEPRSFQREPASSITSIALSGRRRSWTWTAASSAALRSARSL